MMLLFLVIETLAITCSEFYHKKQDKLINMLTESSEKEITPGEIAREIMMFLVQHPEVNIKELSNPDTLLKWHMKNEVNDDEIIKHYSNPLTHCPELMYEVYNMMYY